MGRGTEPGAVMRRESDSGLARLVISEGRPASFVPVGFSLPRDKGRTEKAARGMHGESSGRNFRDQIPKKCPMTVLQTEV
jgi:hypothetical protein